MKTFGVVLTTIVIIVSLSACETTTWKRIDGSSGQYTAEHFGLSLPIGWLIMEDDEVLMVSKDGLDLQRIVIVHASLDKALPELGNQSVSGILPSELAEKFIAKLKNTQDFDMPSLTILSNEPISIAGHTGYSLHLSYKTDKGVRIEILSIGFVDESGYYSLSYRAPTLHYFTKDRDKFDTVVSSFKLR
jgi:hypothetical protein